ncbi:MAG: MmgE/PrpD family protein [Deltaproteobacteria bacterium]|nr:MmgE/PrpD family protein [Deltaproteobacteria bacterium]
MKTTKTLADFVLKTEFRNLPANAIDLAKQAFLDCVGVTLAGSVTPPAQIIMDLVTENGGKPTAAVFGAGFRTASPQAALVNGTSAHSLDYDDMNNSLDGHPSAVFVPTIMALGEELGISGSDAVEAYIIGLEIAAKVGNGINKGHYEKGWHATATLGTLGAAAAAAKILKLDTEKTLMALGIAASEAAGLRQNFGTMTKPFHAGNAARNGMVAAILAKKGFTADKNIIEAEFGFCKLFNKDNQYDLKKITDSLGQPFDIVSPGINLKPYPACLGTHSALDAVLGLSAKHSISGEDVARVEVKTPPSNLKILIHSEPRTGLEGKFSMEFCITIAIMNKKVGVDDFTDETVKGARTQDFIKRVKVIPDPSLEDPEKSAEEWYLPAIVKIRLKNGKEYSRRVDFSKGQPKCPMSREELLTKYRDCAGVVMTMKSVEQSIVMIENMEKIKNLGVLADVLICFDPTC